MLKRLPVNNPKSGAFFRATAIGLSCFLASVNTASGQCIMACQQNVEIALGQTGQMEVVAGMVAPFSALNCPDPLEVTVFNLQNQPIPGNIVNCSHLNQTLNVRVLHTQSGNQCIGSVIVKDRLPPTLTCPDKFIACTADTTAASVGWPTVSDNCTPLTINNLTRHDLKVDLPCMTLQGTQYVTARISRTFSVKDASNNTTTCVQRIWVKRSTLADVNYPPHRDGFAAPALLCGQNPNDLALAGQPTVEGRPILADGDCDLLVAFSDQNIPGCSPASYRVLRTWTVSDYCENTFNIQVQVVRVEDKTAPVLTPPANLTVGTNGQTCSATVTLPTASATDNCSNFNISATASFGSGYAPISGVGQGDYVVTYTATDVCGNATSATMTLTVADDDPPSAVCESDIQVSLSGNGTATLPASSLDNGSLDNCQLQPFTASRDGVNFTPQLQFSCSDIAVSQTVILKVTDVAGFENTCESNVTVRDNLKPTIQCPSNRSLTCKAGFTDPSVTGEPLASDNCGSPTLTFSDQTNLSACNVGSIVRTWRATDGFGNTATCQQQITLTLVNTLAVQFPADVTVNACFSASSIAPTATGQPTFTGQSCKPPSVIFTDETVSAPPACFNILRKWKVVDFCVYDPANGPAGMWERTQVIKVFDQNPPTITPLPDLTVSPNLPDCKAQVVLPDLAVADCSPNLTVQNNSPFAFAQGINASGAYPPGVHTVVFTASDGCGHTATSSVKITVLDQTPPIAACANNFIVNILQNGTTTLDAKMLGADSQDNCTPTTSMTYSADPATVNCSTLGPRPVVVTVTDAAGNTSTCVATVVVQDGLQVCAPKGYTVTGAVRTEGNVPVANIPVRITTDGFAAFDDCSTAGEYFFNDVPQGNFYKIKPENRNKWLNGVTTFDLLTISKHILGINPLSSPYKMIAADANRSGTVTTFDIVQIRKVILGILDTFPGNSSWRFIPKNFTFQDLQNPFAGGFPEEITIPTLDTNQSERDFVAIKVGDVNLSANAADARSPEDTVFLKIENLPLKAGFRIVLPVKIENWQQVEGFQCELRVDTTKARLREILFFEKNSFTSEHLGRPATGLVSLSWDNFKMKPAPGDSLLFSLVLEPKTDADVADLLHVEKRRLQPEAYNIGIEKTSTLDIRWTGAPQRPARFAVLQNQPNPFSEKTSIPFDLPQPAEVTLQVSDALGKVVLKRVEKRPRGFNEFEIRREELRQPGIYFFHVFSPVTPDLGGRMILEF